MSNESWPKPTYERLVCSNKLIAGPTERIRPPERSNWMVAVYEQSMCYGGPEEDGWWYDAGSLVRIVKVFPSDERAYSYARRLNERLRSRQFGPNQGKREYTSVLSEGELQAHVYENMAPASFPDRRPHYE